MKMLNLQMEKAKPDVANPTITWPALILAANRNERVRGRIKDLKVSTRSKNLAIAEGEFVGSRWAAVDFVLMEMDIITNISQIGILIDSPVNRWDLIGNT